MPIISVKTSVLFALSLLALSACATPVTTLMNPKTKQTVTCGGSDAASYAGGAIGYHLQKDKDADCVNAYIKKGFTVK